MPLHRTDAAFRGRKSDVALRHDLEQFAQRVFAPRSKKIKQALLAHLLGVSQAQISLYLRGKSKPASYARAVELAKNCQLTKAETTEYLALCFGTTMSQSVSYYDLVHEYEADVEHLYHLRLSGATEDVITIVDDKTPRIRKVIQLLDGDRIANRFRTALARMLLEQANAFAIVRPRRVVELVIPVYQEVLALAKVCEDTELAGLAEHRLGLAYYITQDYKASIPPLMRALQFLRDDSHKLWVYRTLLLDFAYLKNRDGFNKGISEVRRILTCQDELRQDLVCLMYESLGRSLAILREGEPFEEFEMAERAYTKICERCSRSPFRRTQITRSQVEAIEYLGTKDYAWLEPTVRAHAIMAREMGFVRHAILIETTAERVFV